jgi:hypothetical protein
MEIAEYRNKLYRIVQIENELFLMSRGKKEEEFTPAIGINGKVIDGLYEKKVKEEELEDAYEFGYEAYYKGEKFDTASVEDLWNEGNIRLDTENIDFVEKYEFEVMDRSWFYKRVKAEEIEALIEYKVPILQFENTKQMTSRKIPKEEIMDYAKYMASFA